jgi:PAS domain S-box-containing protein
MNFSVLTVVITALASVTYTITMSDPEAATYLVTNLIAAAAWVTLGVLIHLSRVKFAPEVVRTWIKGLSYTMKVFAALSVLRCLANISWVYHFFSRGEAVIFILNNMALAVAVGYASVYYKRLPQFLNRLARHQRLSRRFTVIADASADAFFEVDEHGNIWYANKAAADIFGFFNEARQPDPKAMLGLNFIDDLVAPEDMKRMQERRAAFLLSGKSDLIGRHTPMKIIARRRRSEVFPIEVTVSAYDKEDRLAGARFCIIARDISYRMVLEKELSDALKP